jgi:hypothetical protein
MHAWVHVCMLVCLCVCVCVRACVRVCVCVCVGGWVWASEVRFGVHAQGKARLLGRPRDVASLRRAQRPEFKEQELSVMIMRSTRLV